MLNSITAAQRAFSELPTSYALNNSILEARKAIEKQIQASDAISAINAAKKAFADFNVSSTNLASSILEARKVIEKQIQASSTVSAVYAAKKALDDFNASSNLASSILEARKAIEKQIQASSAVSAINAAKKALDDFNASSNLANSILEARRAIEKQIQAAGAVSTINAAKKALDDFNASSNLASSILEARKAIEKQIRAAGILTAAEEVQRELYWKSKHSRIPSTLTVGEWDRINFVTSTIMRLNDISIGLEDVDYAFSLDGTITSQGTTFKQSDVQGIIESCLEDTIQSDKINFETAFNKMLNNIENLHPLASKLIIHIILPLFIHLAIILFTSQTTYDYTKLVKNIKKEVQQVTVCKDVYDGYRFVSSSSLTVWSYRNRRSKHIGRLYFGSLVRVLEKKKNWSLIEYRDRGGEVLIRGWVFTRYIKRFD
jgi:hypothetical protein